MKRGGCIKTESLVHSDTLAVRFLSKCNSEYVSAASVLCAAEMCEPWGYEMQCGLCKGSWQVEEKWGHLVLFSAWCVCVCDSEVQTERLCVKRKIADTYHTRSQLMCFTCISARNINISNYLCVLHTSKRWHSTVVRACGAPPAHLSMEVCSAFWFCPANIYLHVSAVMGFLHFIWDTAEKEHI